MNTNIVKKVMKRRNLKQVELAKKLGVAPSNVSLWANGYMEIPKKHLPKLKKLLN